MQCTKCLQYVKVAKFSLPPFELEIINLILDLNKMKLRKVNCFAQSNKANKEQKCKPESPSYINHSASSTHIATLPV